MRVTFDTNVWKRVVFPECYTDKTNYAFLVKIKEALRSAQISGFISESFATIEAIDPKSRARFYAQSVPNVKVTNKAHGDGLHSIAIEILANHSLHPGIGDKCGEELDEAIAIGIKLLTSPYIGLVIPDRLRTNPQIYAEEAFATADYNERFDDLQRREPCVAAD